MSHNEALRAINSSFWINVWVVIHISVDCPFQEVISEKLLQLLQLSKLLFTFSALSLKCEQCVVTPLFV